MSDQPITKAQVRSILEELFVIPPGMADEDIKPDWTLNSIVEYVDRRRDQTLLS